MSSLGKKLSKRSLDTEGDNFLSALSNLSQLN